MLNLWGPMCVDMHKSKICIFPSYTHILSEQHPLRPQELDVARRHRHFAHERGGFHRCTSPSAGFGSWDGATIYLSRGTRDYLCSMTKDQWRHTISASRSCNGRNNAVLRNVYNWMRECFPPERSCSVRSSTIKTLFAYSFIMAVNIFP